VHLPRVAVQPTPIPKGPPAAHLIFERVLRHRAAESSLGAAASPADDRRRPHLSDAQHKQHANLNDHSTNHNPALNGRNHNRNLNQRRLNQNLLGGAWCPNKPISSGTFGQEWIQVKFNRSFVISAIETQGRFALGSGKEFVPSYQIIYSRNNGLTWHKWKDFRGSHVSTDLRSLSSRAPLSLSK
jgi:hypothetical protein